MSGFPAPPGQGYGADYAKLLRRVAALEAQIAQLTTGPVACTSSTRPATPNIGMQIFETDTGKIQVWTGMLWTPIQLGAWTTGFVPTWTQTGASPAFGNATVTTGYAKVGRTVLGRYQFIFGSTTNFGSGANAWNFSLPFTPVVPASGFWNIGTWSALCAGSFYTGAVRVEGTGVEGLFVNNSAFSLNPTNPGTWASGNYVQMSFQYESTS